MIDVHSIMRELALSRPIFHSEADFQHALAWLAHKSSPQADVRLELPVEAANKPIHLDLWLSAPSASVAIELKYKTRFLSAKIGKETFRLKDQAAQDLARYDYVKDISRLEELVSASHSSRGLAIFLTNDSGYWKRSAQSSSVDSAFRLHEARSLHGRLEWDSRASQGTVKGREEPLTLRGEYLLGRQDYSRPSSSAYGTFRYLALTIG